MIEPLESRKLFSVITTNPSGSIVNVTASGSDQINISVTASGSNFVVTTNDAQLTLGSAPLINVSTGGSELNASGSSAVVGSIFNFQGGSGDDHIVGIGKGQFNSYISTGDDVVD